MNDDHKKALEAIAATAEDVPRDRGFAIGVRPPASRRRTPDVHRRRDDVRVGYDFAARFRDIVDETCGLQAADTTHDELLTILERKLFEHRREGSLLRARVALADDIVTLADELLRALTPFLPPGVMFSRDALRYGILRYRKSGS